MNRLKLVLAMIAVLILVMGAVGVQAQEKVPGDWLVGKHRCLRPG